MVVKKLPEQKKPIGARSKKADDRSRCDEQDQQWGQRGERHEEDRSRPDAIAEVAAHKRADHAGRGDDREAGVPETVQQAGMVDEPQRDEGLQPEVHA